MSKRKAAITCPECSRRYALPEGSIGPEGREVRCGTCGHTWTARPDEEKALPPLQETPSETVDEAPAPTRDQAVEDQAVDHAMRTVLAPMMEHRGDDEERVVRPKSRRSAKIVTVMAAIAALCVGGAGVLMTASPRRATSIVAGADAGSGIRIAVATPPSRTKGARGEETITTTATISNASQTTTRLPELQATLNTMEGGQVRTWRIRTDASLAPGETRRVRIGTTATGVPEGALRLDVVEVEKRAR